MNQEPTVHRGYSTGGGQRSPAAGTEPPPADRDQVRDAVRDEQGTAPSAADQTAHERTPSGVVVVPHDRVDVDDVDVLGASAQAWQR